MNFRYSFGTSSKARNFQEAKIKAVAFLALSLIITQVFIEFFYKFNPTNLPQFLVACVFSGFLSCWLIAESYSLSKYSKSNRLLLLVIVQFLYSLCRELFLVLNYQSDDYYQYQNALQRLDFKAFPFLFIYCVIFALQLGQILKLFVEYVKSFDENFEQILNFQPIALICFSRSDNSLIFINKHFTKILGFKEKDIPTIKVWIRNFKKDAFPCLNLEKDFSDFQTDIYNDQGENRIVRISRVVLDELIIDALLDVTEEEQKNSLIRQYQKELHSRAILDQEIVLEQANKKAAEYETENKLLISSLLKVNRTLSSGALVASIAHELNQPLASMNLNLELLSIKMNKDKFNLDNLKILVQKIISDNLRMGSIIYSLRSTFLDSYDSITLHSVNEVIVSVTSIIQHECITRNIDIQLEIPVDFRALFRPDEIRQVLLNVIGNSINILENVMDRPRIIRITSTKIENYVNLSIFDNGPGVSAIIEPILFELHTTTKEHGLGLGLWLSKYILTKSGGEIKYQRIEGWGATFQIQLPIEFQQSASMGGA